MQILFMLLYICKIDLINLNKLSKFVSGATHKDKSSIYFDYFPVSEIKFGEWHKSSPEIAFILNIPDEFCIFLMIHWPNLLMFIRLLFKTRFCSIWSPPELLTKVTESVVCENKLRDVSLYSWFLWVPNIFHLLAFMKRFNLLLTSTKFIGVRFKITK